MLIISWRTGWAGTHGSRRGGGLRGRGATPEGAGRAGSIGCGETTPTWSGPAGAGNVSWRGATGTAAMWSGAAMTGDQKPIVAMPMAVAVPIRASQGLRRAILSICELLLPFYYDISRTVEVRRASCQELRDIGGQPELGAAARPDSAAGRLASCCNRPKVVRRTSPGLRATGCVHGSAYSIRSAPMWHDMFVIQIPIAEKILRTVLVYATILILFRLTGKRDLATLNMFDFAVLFLLSNVVQNAIIGNDTSLLGGV